MPVDVVTHRKQCGHGDPVEEGWSLQGEEPMWPALLLAAPAPTHDPNIPQRWKELGALPWNGQVKDMAFM